LALTSEVWQSGEALAAEDRFVQLNGLRLYYRETGAGRPLVCIPGWCYTAEVFERNLPVLGESYRAVSYDPRSHGRSTVTQLGNSYAQFGRDLHALLDALALQDVILLGWSLGVTTAYAYFEQFGTDRVAAFISVDETPTIVLEPPDGWGEAPPAEVCGLVESLSNETGYRGFFTDYLHHGYEGEPDPAWAERTVTAAMRTPVTVAALLMADCILRDYRETARRIDGELPILQILRQDWAEAARRWIGANQPHARVEVLGGHLMLHEHAERFNALVLDFLDEALKTA